MDRRIGGGRKWNVSESNNYNKMGVNNFLRQKQTVKKDGTVE